MEECPLHGGCKQARGSDDQAWCVPLGLHSIVGCKSRLCPVNKTQARDQARAVGQPAYHRGYPYPYPYRKYHTRRLAVCSSTACVGCGVRDADCGNGNCEVGEACTAALCAADCPVVAAALRCQPAEVGSGGKPTQVRAVMPQLLHSGWHELGFQHPART